MRKISILAVFLLLSLQVVAENFQLRINFPDTTGTAGMKLYVGPMRADYRGMTEMSRVDENTYAVSIVASPQGFYNLISIKENVQFLSPLYVPLSDTLAVFEAKLKDGKYICFTNDADNRALSAFNISIMEANHKLWEEKPTDKEIRKMYGSYERWIKNAVPKGKISEEVKEYMNIWAYVSLDQFISSLPRALNVSPKEVPLKAKDVLPLAKNVLDSEYTQLFRGVSAIIMRSVSREASLAEKMEWIHSNYKTESLCKTLENFVINNYISKYDYSRNFEAGLKNLEEVLDKYGISKDYAEKFRKKKMTVRGASFPADVVLKDIEGNIVNFDKFRGKYVYVDIWASWCGPCCKEVPYLQKLEKELQNEDVVFVSLSVDTGEAPWKKKMEALDMHGNQLIDASKNFCNLMGINGIPFFLIYDKEGKLYKYNAPRPSAKATRTLLEDLK